MASAEAERLAPTQIFLVVVALGRPRRGGHVRIHAIRRRRWPEPWSLDDLACAGQGRSGAGGAGATTRAACGCSTGAGHRYHRGGTLSNDDAWSRTAWGGSLGLAVGTTMVGLRRVKSWSVVGIRPGRASPAQAHRASCQTDYG
jgi:hypothetical protein